MDKIIDGLWLGGYIDADILVNYGFTHILSIIEKEPEYDLSIFKIKWISIEDSANVKIEKYFDECNEFIHQSITNGGKVYVHCQKGLSRSPTIVIAYLMNKRNLSFDDALGYVSSKRPCICPNLGFILALKEYDKIKSKSPIDI
jgi:protein-tyrosine phosphatase